jgi:hypothetical protein
MTAKVTEYWDRPWYRRGFVAVAAAVLVAGLAVTISRSHSGPVAPSSLPPATNPYKAPNPTALYGHKIAMPPAVMASVRAFVKNAVLREDPGATWPMVDPKVRQGLTRSQWASGNIPIPEFPRSAFASAGVKVVRARQHEILLDVLVGSKQPLQAHPLETLIEFRPRAGGWKISYVGPKGGSIPVPAAQ